jgi:hypothetical protein
MKLRFTMAERSYPKYLYPEKDQLRFAELVCKHFNCKMGICSTPSNSNVAIYSDVEVNATYRELSDFMIDAVSSRLELVIQYCWNDRDKEYVTSIILYNYCIE